MPEAWGWLFAGLAAVLVGLSKTGFPAAGILFVPLMAQVFPAKESVGALLPLLIMADFWALYYYRRAAKIQLLLKLFPGVAMGITLGSFILSRLNDVTLKPVLGALILALIILDLFRQRHGLHHITQSPLLVHCIGIAAGITTTVGNAAGPVVGLYFLILGLKKEEFMGTSAWLFLIMNCSKFPIFISLDIIHPHTLLFALAMLPCIMIGAMTGRRVLNLLPQKIFNACIIFLSTAVALSFILNYFW